MNPFLQRAMKRSERIYQRAWRTTLEALLAVVLWLAAGIWTVQAMRCEQDAWVAVLAVLAFGAFLMAVFRADEAWRLLGQAGREEFWENERARRPRRP